MGKDSLAQIAPAETVLGRRRAAGGRLVNASLSDNIRRAYASERTARVLAGYRRTVGDFGRGQAGSLTV